MFIGHHYDGRYYVKDIDLTEEQRWMQPLGGGMSPSVVGHNPVAFFFDTEWKRPFLVLYRFAPMTLGAADQGSDGITRYSREAERAVMDETVLWSYKGQYQHEPLHAQ